jgi:Family of unknown function (DUF6515)
MKIKDFSKIVFISILCISLTSVNAQSNKKVKQRKHQKVNKHTPHHRYANLPRWGHSYKVAPKNAFIISHSGKKYHYSSGIYYKRVGTNYIIAKAPVGIRVRSLPEGRIKFILNKRKYFYYYGTYYVKSGNEKEFIAVKPPKGAKVDALPEGYSNVEINGDDLYEFEGIYYKAVTDDNNQELYEVVGEK